MGYWPEIRWACLLICIWDWIGQHSLDILFKIEEK